MDQDFAKKMKRKRLRAAAVVVVLALLAGWAVFTVVAKKDAGEITVTVSIDCSTLAEDMSKLEDEALTDYVPSDGVILAPTEVKVGEGETAYDALRKICKAEDIHMEASYTPAYDSYYVEGINYLYEFDGGNLSGWMFQVNGVFPNYGCSEYVLKEGDSVQWLYTCDLGKDIGGYTEEMETAEPDEE